MNVTHTVLGANSKFYKEHKGGPFIRRVPHGQSIYLPLKQGINGTKTYEIPVWAQGLTHSVTQIEVPEHGGALDKVGEAQVVASTLGETLPITRLPELRPSPPRGEVAYFSSPDPIATIFAYGEPGMLKIDLVTYQLWSSSPEQIELRTELKYSGRWDELPLGLSRFRRAVEVAVHKAMCLGCNHIHFAQRRK